MKKIIFDIETRNAFEDVGKADPALLDLSVICAHDSETNKYLAYTQEELPNLWPILEKADMLIGYNSDHFDIPILNKYYPGDLTRIKSLDLLKEIKKSLGRRIKLDLVAEGTLGRKKTGNGLEAIAWWKNGEVDKIKKYCMEDVKITKELYEYALKNSILKYKNLSESREIKLDTSKWEEKENVLITHTLPF
ncbi:helicase [Candidatus Campbellbacteria bacterium CG10_big_fil_rev_8_21_14_0_10_35_52]|uniref:Helicase n=1 Tax=Candidatus Campbellbacteria bacterium CG10_big_fil_rev_8_21_14_0_10_35_52 TaxID=1974527 RepID=A0A2M6WVF2_9BACT|nr:MAG: helicase [Candidatus Campbellbacteria bacterium CG10_big_fil_rev_8_21_14_0_10_35_52]